MLPRRIPSAVFFFLLAACAATPPQEPTAPTADEIMAKLAPQALEMAGFGGYQRLVSTDNKVAQAWFDRGLQLLYGFNHDAAVYAFARAAREDPQCAMAWWGIAHAYGVDVNNPNVSQTEATYAKVAIQEALRLCDSASPVENALIEAAAYRAVHPLPGDRSGIDLAYSDALSGVWEAHLTDPDVGTLYAESMMNMQRWDYWKSDGSPIGKTEKILETLEAAMSLNPVHPGANHFYIHAIEASKTPEYGIPSAQRLERLVPGSGHLVHMPSHIYINVGRYADAVAANERAIRADDIYFSRVGSPTYYRVYFLHNMHFLTYSAMMTGQKKVAIQAVTKMESELPQQLLEQFAKDVDALSSVRLHTLMRFGMWDELVAFPEYEEYRYVSRAMRSYTRSIALANLKRTEEARDEFTKFQRLRKEVPQDWTIGFSAADDVLAVAEKVAEGEILWREGETEKALAALRSAVANEDQLLYAEPPGWMIPVRHALGAILLAAGQPEEAQAVYVSDLEEHPGNAWSLLGLDQSLRRQNKREEAESFKVQLKKAWENADVIPPASCYCGV